MAAVLALVFAGGTVYLLVLIRRLNAVVDHKTPILTTQSLCVPDSLCRTGCTCRRQRAE